MKRIALAAALLLVSIHTASAQDAATTADHEALRKLKNDVVTAINTRNLASIDQLLHQPFMATVITQDSFNEVGRLKAYFEQLFTRSFLRISRMTIEAEADELSQIYTGTISVARGATKEVYELSDGRTFDMRGRWTAVSIKENGQWKVLAVHSGTNFLDNPVITAVEKTTMYFGAPAGSRSGPRSASWSDFSCGGGRRIEPARVLIGGVSSSELSCPAKAGHPVTTSAAGYWIARLRGR